MKTRRTFIKDLSSAAVFGAAGIVFPGFAASCKGPRTYSVSLLGDTHFDSVDPRFYHKDYTRSTSPSRFKAHCAEHVRNAEMWASRMPSLIRASAACRRPDTAFVMQAGDFVQGDCGNPAVHRRMLDDAFKMIKGAFGGDLPVVPAVGNHDIRCVFPQGRITQLVVNSVWTDRALAVPEVVDCGVSEYGRRAQRKSGKKAQDARYADLAGYAEEFRPYVKDYLFAKAAGHYLMEVSDKAVKVFFYGGDSTHSLRTFALR